MIAAASWLCLLAPLAGALLITLAGTLLSRTLAGWISTLSVFVGFAGAVVAFVKVAGREPRRPRAPLDRLHVVRRQARVGEFKVPMQILVDPISLTMMLIITGVGGLIVWYSMGYMKGEDEERRYFAYMAFFVFSMLMLVMGGNLLLLLVGWGLVGLASYLLIGFYHDRPEAVAAAKKAFIMNAIGDATMALALFLVIFKIGTLDFSTTFYAASTGQLSSSTVNLVALGLLGGAVAKSAQLPLHTWLARRDGRPDAGLRPHPRGDDGDGRRLPDRPHPLDLRGRPERPAPLGDHRRRHDPRRRRDRARAVGHQARDRVLDDVADRLHVPRGRDRRLRLRDVPPDDARVLQGAALPLGRRDHPPPRRRAGHPPDGRPAQGDAVHPRGVPRRGARARRHPAALGLLVEGRDHRVRARRRRRARVHARRRSGCSARC